LVADGGSDIGRHGAVSSANLIVVGDLDTDNATAAAAEAVGRVVVDTPKFAGSPSVCVRMRRMPSAVFSRT
jgi:hypothetical protein